MNKVQYIDDWIDDTMEYDEGKFIQTDSFTFE